MGPLMPLFWTSGDVSSGFQDQSGQPYSHLVEAYVLHVPWDSALVLHLLTSADLYHIPAIKHWWGDPIARQTNALPIELCLQFELCITQCVGPCIILLWSQHDNISYRKRGVHVIRPVMGLPLTVVPGDARLYPVQYNSRAAIVNSDYNAQLAGHM